MPLAPGTRCAPQAHSKLFIVSRAGERRDHEHRSPREGGHLQCREDLVSAPSRDIFRCKFWVGSHAGSLPPLMYEPILSERSLLPREEAGILQSARHVVSVRSVPDITEGLHTKGLHQQSGQVHRISICFVVCPVHFLSPGVPPNLRAALEASVCLRRRLDECVSPVLPPVCVHGLRVLSYAAREDVTVPPSPGSVVAPALCVYTRPHSGRCSSSSADSHGVS